MLNSNLFNNAQSNEKTGKGTSALGRQWFQVSPPFSLANKANSIYSSAGSFEKLSMNPAKIAGSLTLPDFYSRGLVNPNYDTSIVFGGFYANQVKIYDIISHSNLGAYVKEIPERNNEELWALCGVSPGVSGRDLYLVDLMDVSVYTKHTHSTRDLEDAKFIKSSPNGSIEYTVKDADGERSYSFSCIMPFPDKEIPPPGSTELDEKGLRDYWEIAKTGVQKPVLGPLDDASSSFSKKDYFSENVGYRKRRHTYPLNDSTVTVTVNYDTTESFSFSFDTKPNMYNIELLRSIYTGMKAAEIPDSMNIYAENYEIGWPSGAIIGIQALNTHSIDSVTTNDPSGALSTDFFNLVKGGDFPSDSKRNYEDVVIAANNSSGQTNANTVWNHHQLMILDPVEGLYWDVKVAVSYTYLNSFYGPLSSAFEIACYDPDTEFDVPAARFYLRGVLDSPHITHVNVWVSKRLKTSGDRQRFVATEEKTGWTEFGLIKTLPIYGEAFANSVYLAKPPQKTSFEIDEVISFDGEGYNRITLENLPSFYSVAGYLGEQKMISSWKHFAQVNAIDIVAGLKDGEKAFYVSPISEFGISQSRAFPELSKRLIPDLGGGRIFDLQSQGNLLYVICTNMISIWSILGPDQARLEQNIYDVTPSKACVGASGIFVLDRDRLLYFSGVSYNDLFIEYDFSSYTNPEMIYDRERNVLSIFSPEKAHSLTVDMKTQTLYEEPLDIPDNQTHGLSCVESHLEKVYAIYNAFEVFALESKRAEEGSFSYNPPEMKSNWLYLDSDMTLKRLKDLFITYRTNSTISFTLKLYTDKQAEPVLNATISPPAEADLASGPVTSRLRFHRIKQINPTTEVVLSDYELRVDVDMAPFRWFRFELSIPSIANYELTIESIQFGYIVTGIK